MENLQDMLNQITNSEISTIQQLGNLKKRKTVYVFKDGILVDTLKSVEAMRKKYPYSGLPLKKGYARRDGYFFSYENNYNPSRENYRKKKPSILVYHQGNFIGEFDTDKQIADKFNLNRRDIQACLTNRKGQKSTKGYTFAYKTNDNE